MKGHANKEFWLAALRAEGPAFRTAVAGADPQAPVPSCSEWTVADLTGAALKAPGLEQRHQRFRQLRDPPGMDTGHPRHESTLGRDSLRARCAPENRRSVRRRT